MKRIFFAYTYFYIIGTGLGMVTRRGAFFLGYVAR